MYIIVIVVPNNLLSPSSGAMLCPSLGHTCRTVQGWTYSIVLYDLHVFCGSVVLYYVYCIVLPSFIIKLLLLLLLFCIIYYIVSRLLILCIYLNILI